MDAKGMSKNWETSWNAQCICQCLEAHARVNLRSCPAQNENKKPVCTISGSCLTNRGRIAPMLFFGGEIVKEVICFLNNPGEKAVRAQDNSKVKL